jgi:signal transduction histidine kinase/ActR/RegA family two-component response regulator
VSKNTSQYVFDHGELGRHDISMDLLPGGSIILNKPETFYEEHKSLFWPFGSVFIFLFLALLTALVNIRSHRKNQKQFRNYVNNLETIFNSTPNILFLVNKEGRVEDVNHKGLEFTGKAKEEVVGLLVEDVLCGLNATGSPADDISSGGAEFSIHSRILDAFGTGTNQTGEEGQMTLQLNGESVSKAFLISTSILVVRGVRKVLLCLADITERKQNEDKIRKSSARYQTIMNTMEYPICIASQAFVIEYLNAHMIRRIGYDATGEPCFKAIHGFDKPCAWCDYGKIKLKESRQINIVSPLDNRSFDVSSNPLVNDDGSVSMLHVFRDVTQIKQMEQKLHQAQKMEAIGLLAGGIAHDFNNILSPIIGYTQILLEEISDNELLQSSLDEILTASMRAKELVHQILTFSRQGNEELRPLKVQPIVKETLKLIRSSIPRSIEIIETIQTDCGLVRADPTHIHQILMNLTTNAFHAMEEIGGKMEVKVQEVVLGEDQRVGKSLQPGKYVLLSVTDNGCGIPQAYRDKLFEPYFTTKEKNKGTGLGLSILYGIVKDYRGDIDFFSEVGKGTTFNVYLPLIKMASPSESGRETEILQGGTEKILLVDDEAPILRFQKQMLERLGYKVSERSSSVDALEAFKADIDSFDLVVTDMSMPNMSGEQLAGKILAIRPDLPVIICSGFIEKMIDDLARTMGMKGFLMKPVVKSVMAKEVRRILDEHRLARNPINAQ